MLNKYTSITYFFNKVKEPSCLCRGKHSPVLAPLSLLRNGRRGRCMTERVGAELDLCKQTTFTWKNSQELF